MKRLLTSCFGCGFSKYAPGTIGSVPPVVLFMVLGYFVSNLYVVGGIMLAISLFSSWVCVAFSDHVINLTGKKDPSEVVADEVAGQSLALALAVLVTNDLPYICTTAILLFLFFRIFDITKLWPVCRFEKFPGGWGILLDDLMAGVYAFIVYYILWYNGSYFGIESVFRRLFDNQYVVAGILGAVQGLTEFLPVSSSGHLVLFENMFGMDANGKGMLLFDLSTHVGTVGAILVVFRKQVIYFANDILGFRKYDTLSPVDLYKESPAIRLSILAVITTLVTMLIYKSPLNEPIKNARFIESVTICWFVTATLLLITDMKKHSKTGLRDFGILMAVLIGVAQAAALLPGISRSGSTICVAILLGLRRQWAIQYSFLIGMIAILGATVLEFKDNYQDFGQNELGIGAIIFGVMVSFAVGILALRILIIASKKRNLKIFAIYCYLLACSVGIYILFFKQ